MFDRCAMDIGYRMEMCVREEKWNADKKMGPTQKKPNSDLGRSLISSELAHFSCEERNLHSAFI